VRSPLKITNVTLITFDLFIVNILLAKTSFQLFFESNRSYSLAKTISDSTRRAMLHWRNEIGRNEFARSRFDSHRFICCRDPFVGYDSQRRLTNRAINPVTLLIVISLHNARDFAAAGDRGGGRQRVRKRRSDPDAAVESRVGSRSFQLQSFVEWKFDARRAQPQPSRHGREECHRQGYRRERAGCCKVSVAKFAYLPLDRTYVFFLSRYAMKGRQKKRPRSSLTYSHCCYSCLMKT